MKTELMIFCFPWHSPTPLWCFRLKSYLHPSTESVFSNFWSKCRTEQQKIEPSWFNFQTFQLFLLPVRVAYHIDNFQLSHGTELPSTRRKHGVPNLNPAFNLRHLLGFNFLHEFGLTILPSYKFIEFCLQRFHEKIPKGKSHFEICCFCRIKVLKKELMVYG